MTTIYTVGSSTAFGLGVNLEQSYPSLLDYHFTDVVCQSVTEQFLASNYLISPEHMNFENNQYTFYILHFRADELLVWNWHTPIGIRLRNFYRQHVNYYIPSQDSLRFVSRVKNLVFQFFFFGLRALVPLVSGKIQRKNFEFFLEKNRECRLIIIVLDSRRKILTPLLPHILRFFRSIKLKLMIKKFKNALIVDYSDLKLKRSHFQIDGTHLNSDGHAILAASLIKSISDVA